MTGFNPIADHEVTEDNRLRIVDWFVQVFRVLRVTNQETFFLAVSLLDNYMIAKSQRGVTLTADNLYLIGMSSVFIASKYEDIVPIFMKQMLDDVGHFKFTRTHILSMEREMLSTLGFKIVNNTYTSYH